MLKDVWNYLCALLAEWKAWLSSSFVLGIVGLVLDAIPSIQMPWWGWGVLFLLGIFVAQFKAYQHLLTDKAKAEKDRNEYAYTLKIQNINVDERREGNQATGQVDRRWLRQILVLRNGGNKPIRWEVKKFEIDGRPTHQSPVMWSGTLPNSEDTFSGHFIEGACPVPTMETTILNIEILYGPADQPFSRRLSCTVRQEFWPHAGQNGRVQFHYDSYTDENYVEALVS